MKHTRKSFKAVAAAGTILFLLFPAGSATAQFFDDFSSSVLDPAWTVVPGARYYYTYTSACL